MYFKKGNDEFVKTNALKNTYWAQQHWSELYEKVNPVRSLKMRLKVLKSYDSLKISTTLTDEIIGDIAMNYDNISRNKDLTNKLNINNLKNYEYVLKQNANSYYNRYFKQSNLKDNLLNYQLVLKQYSSFEFKRFNYKSAFEKLSLSTKINDSIFSQENKNKIAKLEAEKEIQINKLKLAAEQKQKYLYILGLGFMSILGLLLVYQNKKRKTANQKLALLNNELDQANKVKMRFFCILNHDLRSPVSNLIDYLHLQRDSPELMDESSKKRMETNTISGAENLLSSMEDILLWSKGQMEQFKPVIKNIAVSKIFDDNKKVFSGYQKIKFVYENNENLIVNTDENYLKTIVRNLTSNAINVFSTTENPIIIWKSYSINNKNYLSITDNGPGSNQENFKALYDENEVVGIKSGLGLHLIRDLAKAINCDIKVDSKIGVGTTFILSL